MFGLIKRFFFFQRLIVAKVFEGFQADKLGIKEGWRVIRIDSKAVAGLNTVFSKFRFYERNPDTIFIPFPDRHIDHRIIFDSGIVASRPINKSSPKTVLLYETLSETHWNVPGVEASFVPDFFVRIDNQIKNKLMALRYYKSQINNKTPSRSIEAIKALAKFRGSQNGCKYAEAFKVVRIVI